MNLRARCTSLILSLTLVACSGGSDDGTANAGSGTGQPPTGGAGTGGTGGAGSTTGADAPPPDTRPEGGASGDTITGDNLIELISQVFAVFSGNAFDVRMLNAPVMAERFAGVAGTSMDGNTLISSLSCLNGGSAESRVIGNGNPTIYNVDYAGCQEGTAVYNGFYSLTQSSTTQTIGTRQFSIEDQPDSFESEGLFELTSGDTQPAKWRTLELNYTARNASGSLVVENATTEYSVDGDSATLKGSFTLRPPAVNGLPVGVSTPENETLAMRRVTSTEHAIPGQSASPRSPTFSSGQLRITADDGTSLTLQPLEGDATQAHVILSNAGGEQTFDLAWSLWEQALTRPASPQ